MKSTYLELPTRTSDLECVQSLNKLPVQLLGLAQSRMCSEFELSPKALPHLQPWPQQFPSLLPVIA